MSQIPVCLGAFLNKELFLRYGPFISSLDNLEEEHKVLIDLIGRYYREYPDATKISPVELEVYFGTVFPAIKKKDIYDALIKECCSSTDINKGLLIDSLNRATDFSFSASAIKKLIEFLEGKSKIGMESLAPLLQEYLSVSLKIKDDPVELIEKKGYHEIIADTERDGLKWSLNKLNDIIGPIFPGTIGHVLARPETGKTAFGLSQLAYFAYQLKQTNRSLIYFGNEESVFRSKARFYTSLIGQPKSELLQSTVDDVENLYTNKGGRNVQFIDDATSLDVIYQGIDTYKPLVVIIDQGPKVRIDGKQNMVEKRQLIYEEFRRIAKTKNCIVLTLGQADYQASNKKWVGYDHIDQSKVGIPGEADYIIGIGYDLKTIDMGYRYFYVSKNKLGAMFGKFSAKLNAPISRYEEISNGQEQVRGRPEG